MKILTIEKIINKDKKIEHSAEENEIANLSHEIEYNPNENSLRPKDSQNSQDSQKSDEQDYEHEKFNPFPPPPPITTGTTHKAPEPLSAQHMKRKNKNPNFQYSDGMQEVHSKRKMFTL